MFKKFLINLALATPSSLGLTFDDGMKAYENGDYKIARLTFLDLANKGDIEAQYLLGTMYMNGDGVKQDYKKAREWFGKSAIQGFANAQFNLGVIYANGEGVRQDKKIAKEYFGKACDGGYQIGCDNYKILNQQRF